MSGNTSLRFIFESKTKRERKKGKTGENGTVESFMVYTLLFAKYNLDDQIKEKRKGKCIREIITKFWPHILKGRGYLKDKSEDYMVILKCILSLGIWDGLIWLRIETNS